MPASGAVRYSYVYDEQLREWTREPLDRSIVSISGVTPTAEGRLPVDTEITLQGNVIVENIRVSSAPLTEITPSGTFAKLVDADDLVTVINYTSSAKTDVGSINYSSIALGESATETLASGTTTLTITRVIT